MKSKIVIGFLLITALAMAAPARSAAGWDISINIPFPGLFYYYAPPVVAPAPVPYAYGAPVAWPLFYGGYWYRPSGGRWFISAQIGGPWYGVGIESVPTAVMQVPVYREAGRGADGRYIPPRMWYEDGGHRGHGRGHHDD
jgi:hypothetical protein